MFGLRFGVLGALAFAAASMVGTPAQAATCGNTTLFSLVTSSDCTGGSANLNNAQSLAAAQAFALTLGITGLEQIGGEVGAAGGTYLNISFGEPSNALPWAITAAAQASWDNFIILLKAGSGDYSYALFGNITGFSGTYTIETPGAPGQDFKPGLSHAYLYGTDCGPAGSGCAPGETPLPGAVFLMGSVLAGGIGGMQLMRRRRKVA